MSNNSSLQIYRAFGYISLLLRNEIFVYWPARYGLCSFEMWKWLCTLLQLYVTFLFLYILLSRNAHHNISCYIWNHISWRKNSSTLMPITFSVQIRSSYRFIEAKFYVHNTNILYLNQFLCCLFSYSGKCIRMRLTFLISFSVTECRNELRWISTCIRGLYPISDGSVSDYLVVLKIRRCHLNMAWLEQLIIHF